MFWWETEFKNLRYLDSITAYFFWMLNVTWQLFRRIETLLSGSMFSLALEFTSVMIASECSDMGALKFPDVDAPQFTSSWTLRLWASGFNIESLEPCRFKLTELLICAPIFFLLLMESSTYPIATLSDFHPPWRFKVRMSAPESANIVADVRRNECPVYRCESSRPKYSAISFGIAPNVLIPITCCVHLPSRKYKKNYRCVLFLVAVLHISWKSRRIHRQSWIFVEHHSWCEGC